MKLHLAAALLLAVNGANAEFMAKPAPPGTADNLIDIIVGGDNDEAFPTGGLLLGDARCAGTFEGGSDTGIPGFPEKGVILSSGKVEDIMGPNTSEQTTTDFGSPGDKQLDSLIPGFQTKDACILKFDFRCPIGKTPFIKIKFAYVFGSDEYNEFVDSKFNDVFGFFLNGVNYAMLPDKKPVTVNNVNNEDNEDLYMDNTDGKYKIEADGVTKSIELTAFATPNQQNEVKIAIADAGDHIYDSWVLLEEGTFKCMDPGSNGDPHVLTWSGEMFDFMGACDLVLLQNPNFSNGLGMNIHVRTKIKTWWSHIDAAVVRIGDETLEMQGGTAGSKWFWMNGKPNKPLEVGKIVNTKIAGFNVMIQQESEKKRKVVVKLGNGETIVIKSFNEIVRVEVNPQKIDDFVGSVGLMGSFPEGKRLGRDGKTIFEDMDAFGQEWQVLASEPKLFHSQEGAQAPEQCAMPTEAQPKRRLGEAAMAQEDAERACSGVNDAKWREACVMDVLATGDIEIAGAYDNDAAGAF